MLGFYVLDVTEYWAQLAGGWPLSGDLIHGQASSEHRAAKACGGLVLAGLELGNHFDFHTSAHGQLRHAKCTAGVGAAFTKDLADQL